MGRADIPDCYLSNTSFDVPSYRMYDPGDRAGLTLAALPMLTMLVSVLHTETVQGKRPSRAAAAAAIGWDGNKLRLGRIVAETISYVERDAIVTHDALAVLLAKAARLRYSSLVTVAYWGSEMSDPPQDVCAPIPQPDAASLSSLGSSRRPHIPNDALFFSGDYHLCHGQVYTLPQLSAYHTAPPADRPDLIGTFGLPGAPGERRHDDTLLGRLGMRAAELYPEPYQTRFRQLAP